MKGKRNPFVAREGFPFLIACLVAIGVLWNFADPVWALVPAGIFAYLFLIFRDPRRDVPAAPLGVVCPVDGTIKEIGTIDDGVVGKEALRIVIRVNSLGTYTSRSPVEGKIMDFGNLPSENQVNGKSRGLWVRSDEGDDVVLQFHGHRFGLAPLAFMRYGERVGQGQRCAYLRLTRFAEVQLPANGRALVKVGQEVAAGTDLLAKLPHP